MDMLSITLSDIPEADIVRQKQISLVRHLQNESCYAPIGPGCLRNLYACARSSISARSENSRGMSVPRLLSSFFPPYRSSWRRDFGRA